MARQRTEHGHIPRPLFGQVAVTLANLRYSRRKNGLVEVNAAVWAVWDGRSVLLTGVEERADEPHREEELRPLHPSTTAAWVDVPPLPAVVALVNLVHTDVPPLVDTLARSAGPLNSPDADRSVDHALSPECRVRRRSMVRPHVSDF